MRKTVQFSAKTTEDAIEKALAELGLDRDEISVEIIERGKSGFLGFGSVDASIYVTYDAPDETPAAVTVSAADEPEEREPESAQAPTPTSEPERERETPQKQAEPGAAEPVGDAYAERAKTFLSGLLSRMGVNAAMECTVDQNGNLNIELTGEGLGAAIGRRGETLDAIQHLTNYAVNHEGGKRRRIRIDAEGYRARREEALIRLANKQADKVVKYRRSMALDPMNAYERHLVHVALQDRPDVTTASTGAEPNRRVVISYVPTSAPKSNGSYQEWC